MNDIIAQANKDLAAMFGLCWHEMDNGEWILVAQPCDEEKCIHCNASNLHAPRPDFRKMVKIQCVECEGRGGSPKSRDHYCLTCDLDTDAQCNFFIECPRCNGIGSRYITWLQVLAEKNNTWIDFLWNLVWLSVTGGLPVPGGKDLKYEMRPLIVATDINQLLIKYRDWRQKHEAQKA